MVRMEGDMGPEDREILERIKESRREGRTLENFILGISPHLGKQVSLSDQAPEIIKTYEWIVERIGKQQNRGHSYNNFRIYVAPNTDRTLMEAVFLKIFINEFEFYVDWARIAKLNSYGREIPDFLLERVSLWPYESKSTFEKIIESGSCNLENLDEVLEYLRTSGERIGSLAIFRELIEEIGPLNPNLINLIYLGIFRRFSEAENTIFEERAGIFVPKLLDNCSSELIRKKLIYRIGARLEVFGNKIMGIIFGKS